ncbi:MAG: GDSL-type esterase/lipase family protein [Phycisphaerae bacterium]|nr:GDSL-type esterase/lipase family protein [Phycisphaerae bacterium]
MPIARRIALMVIAPLALAAALAFTLPQDKQGPAPEARPASITPVSRSADWKLGRQGEVIRRASDAKGTVPLVFVGDSITEGWETSGKQVWATDIAPLAPAILNLGVGGDRTEHVLFRLEEAPLTSLNTKCVVLMIGTNNLGHGSSTAAQTALGIRTVVDTILAQSPKATVLLLGIFPRGDQFNPMRGEICEINQSLEAFAVRHPSERVTFLDFGAAFVQPDGAITQEIMPDYLHLSPKGYQLWADAITPSIKKILSTP